MEAMKANENIRDEQELHDFLVSQAESIDVKIQEKANRDFFDGQIAAFCRLRELFQQELQKAKEAARNNPELRFSDDDARPPEKGMIPEEYYVLEDPPKGFWRWKLPFNPDAYLARFEAESMDGFYPPEEDAPNEDFELACESALWAAIRDEALKIPVNDRLCKDGDEWPSLLWLGVNTVVTGGDTATLDQRVVQLRRAFRRVMAKLSAGQDKQERSKEEEAIDPHGPVQVDYCEQIAGNLENLIENVPEGEFLTNEEFFGWQKKIVMEFHRFNEVLVWLRSEDGRGIAARIPISENDLRNMRKRVQDDIGEAVSITKNNSKCVWPNKVTTGITNMARVLRHIAREARMLAETGQAGEAESAERDKDNKQMESRTGPNEKITHGQEAKDIEHQDKGATHSIDFRSVCWYGTNLSFTGQQAAVVKILWEAWRHETPDVGDATLLEESGSESKRLRDVFKNHSAWDTMIVPGETKGAHRLVEPAKKGKKAKKPVKAQ